MSSMSVPCKDRRSLPPVIKKKERKKSEHDLPRLGAAELYSVYMVGTEGPWCNIKGKY